MEAAEAAIDAYAFNNAITHLNEALKLLPDDAATMRRRYRLWDMLGIGLRLVGPARRRDRGVYPRGEAWWRRDRTRNGLLRDRRGLPPQGRHGRGNPPLR